MAVSGAGSNAKLDLSPLTVHWCYVTLPAMALLRTVFWVALFLFFTFCFVVLFEYGTNDFVTGFNKEFGRIKTFVTDHTSKTSEKKK